MHVQPVFRQNIVFNLKQTYRRRIELLEVKKKFKGCHKLRNRNDQNRPRSPNRTSSIP